jgi:3'-phosphoadenosine 5'-phosphosulfate sulfotransferase (PAPS reductase)/FAD synthetase
MSLLPDDRLARLDAAKADSFRIITEALESHTDGHTIVARALLFSGGNDSTTLGHFLRNGWLTHAIHIDTGIGIEQTRQHVRDTCAAWGLPLIVKSPPPGSTYRELVLDQGFPGPAHHFKMYQRLKERGLRAARAELVSDPRRERVVFFAGRRRTESARRQIITEHEREGSAIWISPLANWTAEDLNTYRALHDVPRNEVSDLIHMSGECLCGAFAKANELDEIGEWFPDVAAGIRALEADVEAAGQKRCRWGWGADQRISAAEKSGPMCSSCELSRQLALFGA